ncbi:MAG: glycoside hydrolase domain-containing protein [Streptosporangiaceae bacterium]
MYRLDRDPSRCVRYDRHAVYLGQPGANQQCPAHLVGRTATISIQATGSASGPASGVANPVGIGAAIGTLPQVSGSVTRDAQDQEMGTSLADPGVSVTGTYTGGGRGVLSILRSLRRGDRQLTRAGAGPARDRVMTRSTAALLSATLSGTPASTVAVPRAAATLRASHGTQPGHLRTHKGRHHRQARKHKSSKRKTARHHSKRKPSKRHARKHRARKHHSRKHHSRKHPARKHRAHPRTPRLRVARHGFDSCTTPSLAAMRAWRRGFAAMAVYIGGVEAGCASPNLTAGWVRAVTGQGWALMPTYVGPQASCSSFSVRIRPARAEAQGHAAALDAMHQAAALGMGRGSPVYYDMEAYHGHRRCKDATLAFLDAWTRTLHAHGYSSGVYSSASSGAENLGWAHTVDGHAIAKPDSMWFGLWDNEQNVRGLPYLLRSWWRGPRRIKQYKGPHRRTLGGYTLDIDSDWVYGAVYR